jgi:hypothetical protein
MVPEEGSFIKVSAATQTWQIAIKQVTALSLFAAGMCLHVVLLFFQSQTKNPATPTLPIEQAMSLCALHS